MVEDYGKMRLLREFVKRIGKYFGNDRAAVVTCNNVRE